MEISSITNKETYSKLSENILKPYAANVSINGVDIPVRDGKAVTDKLFPASLTGSTPATTIIDYYAPSKIALDTYQKLGYDIDRTLQSSFLLQTFNIKGTDILCSAFCFLISLLSCSARDALYQTVQATNQIITTANTAVRVYNTAVETINAAGEATKVITNSVNAIFNTGDITKEGVNTVVNAGAILASVPSSITGLIDKLSKVLKYSKNLKYSIPDLSGCRIWNLADNVLFALQAMFISVIDEILNKIFKPVEDLINNIQASSCFNNMADAIRVKLLRVITSLKSRIKAEIADIFASNKALQDKMRKANKNHGDTLELCAFLDALCLIGANFQSIARGCGLTPCSNNNTAHKIDYTKATDSTNTNPFSFNITSAPQYSNTSTQDSSYNNIDDIANAFKDFLSPNNLTVSDDTIKSTYNILTNAPDQIKDFVKDGILNYVLDNNYTINPETAVITYKFERRCS